MELLVSLGLKLLPYLAVVGAAVAGYFAIKRRGVKQERAKWEQAQAEVKAKVAGAQGKDAEVDAKVRGQVAEILKLQSKGDSPAAGDKFKF